MLASPGSPGAVADGFVYEFKWDGVRVLTAVGGEGVRAWTRRGTDVTATYPELHDLAGALDREVLLDGEVVALASGAPSFARLQRRMNVRDASKAARLARTVPVAYLVFDCLRVAGEWLLDEPYEQRRRILLGLGLPGPRIQVPPSHDDLGDALRVAQELGLEGVVAKRRGSTYQPGRRSPDWRKLRLVNRQEFVVGGFRPGSGARRGTVGSLLVGYYEDGGLRYAGAVGSGLTDRLARDLRERLEARARDTSPFDDPVPHDDAVFTAPELVVEVQFSEWTPEGVLRQPSLKGLRDDKDPSDVHREDA